MFQAQSCLSSSWEDEVCTSRRWPWSLDETFPGRCSEDCAVPTTEGKRASRGAWEAALEWKPRVPFPSQEEGVGVLGRLSL